MRSKHLLCETCMRIDFQLLFTQGLGYQVDLGPIIDIVKKKDQCNLCSLIVIAARIPLEDDNAETVYHTHDNRLITCSLRYGANPWTAMRDGQEISSGNIVVQFRGHWQEQFIGYSSRFDKLALGDTTSIDNIFRARPMPKEHVNFELIGSWIRTCKSSHTSVEKFRGCGMRDWEKKQDGLDSLRVIDVKKDCIAALPKGEPYLVLSYVWGGVPTLLATKDNFKTLSAPRGLTTGAQMTPIARTIIDSMELTRRVGYQYLWVDSLCIVQDDYEEKALLIDFMELVYLGADMTIVAANGDASAGLPGVQASSRCVKQFTRQVDNDLFLSLIVPSSYSIGTSRWNSRAWTFQERLYSKRVLIFLPDKMYWHCRSVTWDEHFIDDHPSCQDNTMMSHSERLRYLETDESWTHPAQQGHSQSNEILLFPHPTLEIYKWVVLEYTQRNLTYPNDVARAFAGVQNVLRIALGNFVAGVPIRYLDTMLLWSSREMLVRRLTPSQDFPTWSWMGWKGCIGYATRYAREGTQELAGPLLHWYRRSIDVSRFWLRQAWAESLSEAQRQSLSFAQQWRPLPEPKDFRTIVSGLKRPLPLLGVECLLTRSFFATFAIRQASSGNSSSSSSDYDIFLQETLVGEADLQLADTKQLSHDFLIISETELDQNHERLKDLCANTRAEYGTRNFFNVLAVEREVDLYSPSEDGPGDLEPDGYLVVTRRGCGVIAKTAWEQIQAHEVNILLR